MSDEVLRTRDGVEIVALQSYWEIPFLEDRDFSGLHKGRIPSKSYFLVSGLDIKEKGRSHSLQSANHASTQELANRYAVQDYLDRLESEERRLQRELDSLKIKKAKVRDRLNLYLEQQRNAGC